MPESCRTCRFFYFGSCRRRPPVVVVVPHSGHTPIGHAGIQDRTWPRVSESDWCGEYERREGKEKANGE